MSAEVKRIFLLHPVRDEGHISKISNYCHALHEFESVSFGIAEQALVISMIDEIYAGKLHHHDVRSISGADARYNADTETIDVKLADAQ